MSDKLVLHGTGRVVKEIITNDNGTLFVDIVSNLYQKSEDPKNNTHPMWVRCLITANSPLAKFLATKTSIKGCEVSFGGEFNFRPYTKKDGTTEVGYTVFPMIFQVHQTKTSEASAAPAAAASSKPDDDNNPF